ncbi:uncharacterized protein [Nicotiana sylvestris]|uniref:uncharacterized protein n=1 Tax=Nicotiana sylvestris TaxID=4096 RepID=UPI00388C893B
MLERVLQNQEKSGTSTRNMTELVGSHTASIQILEMQMRDLSREQNPKQKGTLPSDTIADPKGIGSGPTSHVMAITTRSGKVLQGGSEQVVEVEKVPEELKVQGENREEVKEKVKETPNAPPPIPRPPPPFPQRLARKVDDRKLERFYDILKQLSVNISFVEVFQEMSGFAKYLKDLITKKRTTKNEVVNVTHRVSSIIVTSTIQKKEDPGAFTIPCTIGAHDFARALCDNGASINLMPLAIYKQAGLGMPRPTSMRLQMADRSIKRPVGIVDNVLVRVGKFHLPADFVILDCAVDKEIPIILGKPFLATERTLIDSERNEIKFHVNDKEVTFQASKGMKLPHEYESVSVIDVVDEVEDGRTMPCRMPFGLCNASPTFQRCMMSIFSDMVENFLELFMDDFSVVDRAKIKIIYKLPPPTSVKGVRSFLGHARFSRRFIKDFSKISNPMCKLFKKDAKFVFDEKCLKAFEELKQRLTTVPIIVTPN